MSAGAAAAVATTTVPVTDAPADSVLSVPEWGAPTSTPVASVAPPSTPVVTVPTMLPMTRWRLAGAAALTAAFALIGYEVQRLVDDRPWSDGLMWGALAAGLVTAVCVVVWTWVATENARRLVGPATNRPLPEPRAAAMTWALPFSFVAIAVVVVAYLGSQIDIDADDELSAIPLGVALIALLLAIPLTYRPLNHLAAVVRQVGGHSSRLAAWMWVPVVLGAVGVCTLVALRIGAVDDDPADAWSWAPLWVVGVVAIVPCVIVVFLAWRASGTVEEAIQLAADRRQGLAVLTGSDRAAPRPRLGDDASEVHLVPGVDVLRVALVTMLAGQALLSIVGATVMLMFWMESEDGNLTPGQRTRAWDALDVLHEASRLVGLAIVALATLWTFVAVLNARRASGRRRNPLVAALAWPAAAVGIWAIADRFVVDQSNSRIVVGFVLQALVLFVPFRLLERSVDTVGARRTPLRITYAFFVVLLVHIQGLGGLSTIEETMATDRFGHLAGYLALGALVQLMSTMAVTDGCRSLSDATEHEAEHFNMLVAQRSTRSTARPPGAAVGP